MARRLLACARMIRRSSGALSYLGVLVACGAFSISCGSKNGEGVSLCNQIPAPAACMQACDPTPGAASSCPSGYHCSPDGHCDAECTQGGGQCGANATCLPDGTCMGNGSGSGTGPDANCPDVHFAAMKTTPSIELLLDRSGSMDMSDIAPTRFQALQNALVGGTGAIPAAQASVYFGATMFAGDQTPCLNTSGFTVPRALNNSTAIATLIASRPPNGGSTPTADAIGAVTADFALNPPPTGSPPIILLATDGEPNSCSNGADGGASVAATQAAYAAGIRLFIIGLANLNTNFLQQMANAGVGATGGTNAPYYTANDPTSLVNAFNMIINGVLSCDLSISGQVDPATAMNGTVTLNGMTLTYGTDWVVDPNGMVIHLLGTACDTLKSAMNPTVDASFPCGSVIF